MKVKGNDLPRWHHRPHGLSPSVIRSNHVYTKRSMSLHSIHKDAPGENQRSCHWSSGDQYHFRISSQITTAEGNFSESNSSLIEWGNRLTMNFSRSIKRPFLWHENIPHHISAMKQQTSFSEYSTQGAAFILNFKASLVFRFLYDRLTTTSITTIQKSQVSQVETWTSVGICSC